MSLRNKALRRWHDMSPWKTLSSVEEKEDALLLMGKKFRPYKHSIYVLQHAALKIQHWFFKIPSMDAPRQNKETFMQQVLSP